MAKPKILHLDIETAPKKGLLWGMWKQNIGINQLIDDTYILCWCAKWVGERKVMSDAIWDHALYKKDAESDIEVLKSVHALLNEADIVIGHNGDRFDIPTLNARFVIEGLGVPSTYKQIDTLKIAKRKFRFTSNRLDALGRFLGVGRKIDTGGMDLWIDVLAKKVSAQKKMVVYCKQDVRLLEKVYNKLKAWDNRHPSLSVYSSEDRPTCNVCSGKVHKKGVYFTNARVYPRYKCTECGHNMRGRYSETKKDEAKNNLVSV